MLFSTATCMSGDWLLIWSASASAKVDSCTDPSTDTHQVSGTLCLVRQDSSSRKVMVVGVACGAAGMGRRPREPGGYLRPNRDLILPKIPREDSAGVSTDSSEAEAPGVLLDW